MYYFHRQIHILFLKHMVCFTDVANRDKRKISKPYYVGNKPQSFLLLYFGLAVKLFGATIYSVIK